MDPKLRRKLIVSGAGLAAFIGILVVAYIFFISPKLKVWREAREEVKKREKRLQELRTGFANQKDPQAELKVLQQEIENLEKVNQQLQKIKTPGTETKSLPAELHDPDPAIRRELYKDYMKQVMDVAGNNLKERLKSAQIAPPDFKLYEDLENADEVAYYMNRAGGLQGLVDAMAQSRTPESTLQIDKLEMENYAAGIKRREGAVNILSYMVKMTLDSQTLLSFLYNLHEQDAYYFIEDMKIVPRGAARGTNVQQLAVEARINTTMIFESQVQAQVKAVLAQAGQPVGGGKGGGGGWMAELARAMKEQAEAEKNKPKRKWYEVWKWFSKE